MELVVAIVLHKKVQALRKYPQPEGCGMSVIVGHIAQVLLGALRRLESVHQQVLVGDGQFAKLAQQLVDVPHTLI